MVWGFCVLPTVSCFAVEVLRGFGLDVQFYVF